MSDNTTAPKTTDEMITLFQKGRGMSIRSTVTTAFLEGLDNYLVDIDESYKGSPDTLILEAEETLADAEVILTLEGQDPVPGRAKGVTLTQTRELRGMLWGEPEGLVFALGTLFLRLNGKFIQADTPEEEPGLEAEWRRYCEALNGRNEARGFKPLFPLETFPDSVKTRRPTGKRIKASRPDLMRLPTAKTAHDTMTAFFAPNTWRPNAAGTAIYAQRNETQVMLDCDDAIGFGPERAIQQIAQHGPATAQTFLALAGLWLRDNKSRSHETYMTIGASDLLRFQGRKPSSNHGFDNDEIMAKGRDVWVLSCLLYTSPSPRDS